MAGVVLAGCSTLTSLTAPAPVDPKTQMPALEHRIYTLVKAERRKINPKAKALTLDPELTNVARERSDDMAAKHYMAHRAPDGETSTSLIMAQDATFQGLLGENIAAEYYTKSRGINVDAYAKRFVDTWLASKRHRDNLAFGEYVHTGVGAAVNGNTIYVTELFSAPLAVKPPAAPDDTRKTPAVRHQQPIKTREPEAGNVHLRGSLGPGDPN